MKAVVWTLTGVLTAVLIVLAFLFISPSYNTYVVRSESMTPAIDMGDMVVVGPPGGVFGHGVVPGTVVVYRVDDSVVTHRVQSVEGDYVTTKGDAVTDPDSQKVHTSQILGAVLLTIPKLGYVSSFVRTRTGWLVLIFIPTMIVLGLIIKELITHIRIYRNESKGVCHA